MKSRSRVSTPSGIQETFPYRTEANYNLVNAALEKTIADGYLSIPTAPGLGVELNDDALKDQTCVRVK